MRELDAVRQIFAHNARSGICKMKISHVKRPHRTALPKK